MSEVSSPALSVLGIRKDHARRAIKWLRDRNMLAFYRSDDKSLNAFEFKQGAEFTYEAMRTAIDATRKW